MHFKDLITEKSDTFSIIYDHYSKWLEKEFKLSKPIKLSVVKKINAKTFGYVDLKSIDKPKYNIKVESGALIWLLGNIAHEATHLKQIDRKELTHNEDIIVWKGKEFINVNEYNLLSYDEYAKLPWEVEAIKNQTKLSQQYIKKTITELKGKTSSLDFIIDNLV